MRNGLIIFAVVLLVLFSSGCVGEGQTTTDVKPTLVIQTISTTPLTTPPTTMSPLIRTPTQIPLATITPAPTKTPTPEYTNPPIKKPTPSLEINDYSYASDPNGKGMLKGIVTNNAEFTYTNVQIEGIFYNSDAIIVETKKSYPLGAIEPKQSKKFTILTEKLITYTDYYEIIIHTTSEHPTQTTAPPSTTLPPTTYHPPSAIYSPISISAPLDSDGDGVADAADQCPSIYGKIAFKGCLTPPTLPTTPKSTWSNEYISREYKWTFKGRDYSWKPQFSENLYNYYKNKPRPSTNDYSIYATDPYDDDLISQIVNMFKTDSEREGFDKFETVNFVISFVQSLPYTSDDVTTPYDEYPRYPIETLVDDGGDCEDTAILVGALISELDYGVVLLDLPGHMAVGVKCDESLGSHYNDDYGNSYCYLETTGEGWKIGEIPDEYKGLGATFRYLVPKPIITLEEWSYESVSDNSGYYSYKITVPVENEGTATAENLKIYAMFDSTEEGKVWAQSNTESYDLDPGRRLEIIVPLSVPRGVYTRPHIVIVGDNFLRQEYTASVWKYLE